jgi:hypothetical protein
MRGRSLIMAVAGAVLVAGALVPAAAMASPSPTPVTAAHKAPVAAPLQATDAPADTDPALLRRCLMDSLKGAAESAECVPLRDLVRKITKGTRTATPKPAATSKPSFTG